MYEADVTDFLNEYKKLNKNRSEADHITVNTIMLRVVCEGLKAAPAMNAHIEYDRKLVRGKTDMFEQIDVSMPMLLPDGGMMTVTMRDFGDKNLDEMSAYIADIKRRMANIRVSEAMFSVSVDDTLKGLSQGKVKQTAYRLIGSTTGKHRVRLLRGKEKRAYKAIPAEDRLTKDDIRQGTVTVSNIGSLYKGQRGAASLLEIIPPQVCAFAIGAIQEKPAVVTKASGKKDIEIRQIMPICIAFDHRALDFGDVVPFLKKLDGIFEKPCVIHSWTDRTRSFIHDIAI